MNRLPRLGTYTYIHTYITQYSFRLVYLKVRDTLHPESRRSDYCLRIATREAAWRMYLLVGRPSDIWNWGSGYYVSNLHSKRAPWNYCFDDIEEIQNEKEILDANGNIEKWKLNKYITYNKNKNDMTQNQFWKMWKPDRRIDWNQAWFCNFLCVYYDISVPSSYFMRTFFWHLKGIGQNWANLTYAKGGSKWIKRILLLHNVYMDNPEIDFRWASILVLCEASFAFTHWS